MPYYQTTFLKMLLSEKKVVSKFVGKKKNDYLCTR